MYVTFEPPGEAVICGQENRVGDGLGTRLSSVCIDSNTQKWTSSLVTTLVAMTTADNVTFIGIVGGHDSCYCHTHVNTYLDGRDHWQLCCASIRDEVFVYCNIRNIITGATTLWT